MSGADPGRPVLHCRAPPASEHAMPRPDTDTSLTDAGEITRLLRRHHGGDRAAFDALVPLVYQRLQGIARRQLAQNWRLETLGATALVHEAYVQLCTETSVDWQSRSHFFAVSARAMRRILVDSARRRRARKRGGGAAAVALDMVDVSVDNRIDVVLAVDEALSALEDAVPRLAHIVECRFFAGMTEEETAIALELPLRTVQREWTRARAWLLRELRAAR
jgi:RNA polymerase sigma factor (TIGR02999 family)